MNAVGVGATNAVKKKSGMTIFLGQVCRCRPRRTRIGMNEAVAKTQKLSSVFQRVGCSLDTRVRLLNKKKASAAKPAGAVIHRFTAAAQQLRLEETDGLARKH